MKASSKKYGGDALNAFVAEFTKKYPTREHMMEL